MTQRSLNEAADQDRGAALILAIVLILVIGVATTFLAQMSTGAILTSENLSKQRSQVEDAETAVTLAMEYVRYDFNYASGNDPVTGKPASQYVYTSNAEGCLPPGVTIPSSNPNSTGGNPDIVSCTGSLNPFSAATRTVVLTACTPSGSSPICTSGSAVLEATVVFNDQDATGGTACGPSVSTSCGTAMTVAAWDVIGADS